MPSSISSHDGFQGYENKLKLFGFKRLQNLYLYLYNVYMCQWKFPTPFLLQYSIAFVLVHSCLTLVVHKIHNTLSKHIGNAMINGLSDSIILTMYVKYFKSAPNSCSSSHGITICFFKSFLLCYVVFYSYQNNAIREPSPCRIYQCTAMNINGTFFFIKK